MYNKAFKSDSQRLAVSLRSSIAKRRSHLNAALCNCREKDRNVLKIKVFYDFFTLNLASTLYVQYF
ncbi:hypothetical protein FKN05_16350 [Vibrio sp. 1-1(7)]|nr:hypothetical protein [Vibrio sp. 1-1(7)]NNN74136.1 hypothetical protein [Vibrio sp. 12-2(3-a)]